MIRVDSAPRPRCLLMVQRGPGVDAPIGVPSRRESLIPR